MDVSEFHRRLRETGSFRTEAPRRPLPPFVAGLAYHLRMMRIYAKGYLQSAHADFREREWAPLSFEVVRVVERCGGRVAFEGFENVRALGGEVLACAPCGEARHVFTHVEWHMTGFLLTLAGECGDYVWRSADEIRAECSIPTAFRFYLKQIK